MSTTGTETAIPFLDLSRQHKEIETELTAAISNVFSRGTFVLGEEVCSFESEWAAYCGTGASAGVASGTDAIALALLASGAVSPGRRDEVITAAISAGYTALAIRQAGAVPIFADIDPDTALIDPASVERLIGPRTKAIVPVHLYGQICDMQALSSIAGAHGLTMVEDAAQAHGAWRLEPTELGRSRTAAFSFYPTKNLGACGDGGAVVSDDAELIERVKLLRQGGHPTAMTQNVVGQNSRLDEIQAAILRVKLKRLDAWNQRRARLADFYDGLLARTRVRPVERLRHNRHANHLYVVRSDDRDELRTFLRTRGIETLIHYPTPLHREPLFESDHDGRIDLPAADALSKQIVSLPLNSHSADSEIEAVGAALIEFDRKA